MSATWGKSAGAILHTGDSTCVGNEANTGGWRPGVTATLTSDGWAHRIVGSVSSTGLCYAIGATALTDFLDAGAYPLSVEVAAQRPFVLVLSTAFNDFRSGDGVGGAGDIDTIATRFTDLLDDVYAVAPWLRVVVPQCLPVVAGDPAGWPVFDLAGCNAAISTWNSTRVPAIVATQNAAGRHLAQCAAHANPVRSDFVHPVDGATGYDLMYPPIVAAIEAIKPR